MAAYSPSATGDVPVGLIGMLTRATTTGSVLFLFILVLPAPALAYDDPGILEVLYQAMYVFIFGSLVAWILRPWNYVKGLLGRFRKRATGADATDSNEPHP